MMRLKAWALVGSLFIILVAFVVADLSGADSKPLPIRMQKLSQALETLLPLSLQSTNKQSQRDRENLGNALKELSQLSHEFIVDKRMMEKGVNLDPSLRILGDLLADEAKRAYHEYEIGHYENAKRLSKRVSGYCISCHTSSQFGPQFFADSASKKKFKSMRLFEKAEFYAATRNFDEAFKLFKQVVLDENYAKQHIIEWHEAVRRALAIAVRVKKSPELALELVRAAIASKYTARYFKLDAEAWEESLVDWHKNGDWDLKSDKQAIKTVERVMEKAERKKKYPADNVAEIDYLRLTGYIHEMLAAFPDSKYLALGLYYLGLGYESLQSIDIWELPELYFEQCVRKAPHSDVAAKCFHSYEELIYEGYTGSGGTNIPESVFLKLNELATMAAAKKSPA